VGERANLAAASSRQPKSRPVPQDGAARASVFSLVALALGADSSLSFTPTRASLAPADARRRRRGLARFSLRQHRFVTARGRRPRRRRRAPRRPRRPRPRVVRRETARPGPDDAAPARPRSLRRHQAGRQDAVRARARPVRLWCDDAPFRAVFLDALASEPHRAFFWETPPLPPRDRLDAADETEPWPALDRLAYEHAVVPAPHLASREPEPETFEPHLADARARGALAAVFPNLGGDAWLVSPAGPDVAGGAHLAAFVRDADEDDKHALVKAMVEAVMRRASEKCRAGRRTPTWVSANGAGVAWVHARIDDAPKYFHTREYAVATE
jgi:hypothetical protein